MSVQEPFSPVPDEQPDLGPDRGATAPPSADGPDLGDGDPGGVQRDADVEQPDDLDEAVARSEERRGEPPFRTPGA